MTAQGTEARRGETACGLDAKHDGPVAAGDAPKLRYEGQERRHTRRLSDPVRALKEARDALANPAYEHLEARCRALLTVGKTLNRLEDE